MDKRIGFIVAGILVILIGAYFLFGNKTSSSKKETTQQESQTTKIQTTDDNLHPLGDQTSLWDEALSPFQGNEKKDYLELIEELKTGKINFVWEVWALRRNCPKDYSPSQCDATLIAYIEKNYSSPDKEKIIDLFRSYFKYEDEVRNLKMPENVTFDERYEILKKKRKETLGQDKAELFFGMEEAQVSFIEASKNFMASTKNLSGSERVKKYEELRKKVYGPYNEAIAGREDSFQHYQTELELREKDLSGLSEAEKDKKIAALEIQYFGKEGAERMAKARKEIAEHQAKFTDYEQKEKEFLAANPNLSEKDKEQKLKELRVKALGEEEAEAYAKREKYEEEIKNIK